MSLSPAQIRRMQEALQRAVARGDRLAVANLTAQLRAAGVAA